MSYQGPNENVQSGNEQVQSGSERAQSNGQVQSGSERAHSHGQVQFGGGQAQSSSTSMAVQMLENKNKPREEITPVDKGRQKVELEKSLDSIRKFNQINEEIKESHDKQVTKLKQREEDMRESLRKIEAKFYPDLDQTNDRESSKDLDQFKDSDSDRESSSSDDFFYV